MRLTHKMLKAINDSKLPFDDWSEANKIDLVLLMMDLFLKDLKEKKVQNIPELN